MQRITGAQPALSPLRVRRGRLTVSGRCSYRLAPQLRQWRVVISAEEKPRALLALLQRLVGQLVMVFTGSVRFGFAVAVTFRRPSRTFPQVDATRRLYLMLDAIDADFPVNCVEYSSLQSHTERSRALESFRRRESTVLVASDAATRGLDVEVRPGRRRARRLRRSERCIAHRVSTW
jgi:ATP-dependent RNA helicase DDX51/DBP6